MTAETWEVTWPPRPKPEPELASVHRKLDLIINKIGVVMADVAPLTAAIEELDTDEVAAVDEFKALAEQIAQLTTEKAPSQTELDALTARATAIAAALKAGTPAQAAPAPVPEPTPTPEVPPAPTPEVPPAPTPAPEATPPARGEAPPVQ
jgi:hypothetical protein